MAKSAPKKASAPAKRSAPSTGAAKAPAKAAATKVAPAPATKKAPATKAVTPKPPAKKAASKAAPAKAAPAKTTPAKVGPSKAAPAKAPAKVGPTTAAPSKAASARSGTAKAAPAKAAPAKAGTEAAPKPKPVNPFDAKFLDAQRSLLLEERAKLVGQADHLDAEAAQLMEDLDPGDVQFDDESGEGDSLVVERERDLALAGQARQTVVRDRRRAAADRRGRVRALGDLRPSHPEGAPAGAALGDRAGRGEGWRPRYPPLSSA